MGLIIPTLFKRLQSVLDGFTPPLRLFFTCCFHREKRIQKKGRLVRPFLLPCINIRYNTSLIFHQKPIDDQHTPKTFPDPVVRHRPSY